MKKLATIFLAMLFAAAIMANDIVTLNNQMMFEGKVLKINNCEVVFRAEGKKYLIPAEEIYSIEFEDVNDKVYRGYLSMVQSDHESCFKGRNDAENLHGKEVTHVALGFLFGPFAMIGTAISNPTPLRGRDTYLLSQNKELFSDPFYLNCYRKRAKIRLIGMEAAGWGAWLLLLLVL